MNSKSYKDTHETRIALLEQAIININEILKELKNDNKVLNSKIDSNFKWVMSTIVLGFLLPIILKIFHITI